MIFDIQDVGVRFYTYISSLQEYMEAAFENSKPLLVLDRPNPNGHYIDGPVLDTAYKSFVGMQPVPIVYGLTIGEYAFMIAGEKWLTKKANEKHDFYKTAQNSPDTPFHFQVIKNANYDHNTKYRLPVMPSPNLKEMQSIWWYPSTCFFEGTVLSEGRGTDKPFEQIGAPWLDAPKLASTVNAMSLPGVRVEPITMSVTPPGRKFVGQTIPGLRLVITDREAYRPVRTALLIIDAARRQHPNDFKWTGTIDRLTGSDQVRLAIEGGRLPQLLEQWDREAAQFREDRKPYLLY
jgi:uncharacterized protein YbbC (DUF1343 family)